MPTRILLVEDQPAHAELIQRSFERTGASVVVARTLAEARGLMATIHPELVIADLVLGDGRGTELLGHFTVPIIILTSHGDEVAAVEAMRKGAADYVVKSDASIRELPHLVERSLRETRLLEERRRAEAAASERQARFESLVRHIPGAVYRLLGSDLEVELLSDPFADISGYPTTRFFGAERMDLARIIHPEDRARVTAAREAALFQLESYALEYRIEHADGSLRWVTDRGIGVVDEASHSRWIDGVIFDVSEKVRMREVEAQLRQSQKLESIGRLAAGLAHDFNNLLTVILANCGLLLHTSNLAPQPRALVEDIHRAGERSSELTRQLLAFGRRQALAPELVDPNRLLTDLRRLLERVLGEDIQIDLRLATVPFPIVVDRGQLEQVLVNLAVNARDAMPSGGQLTLTTRNVTLTDARAAEMPPLVAGDHLLVEVKDTGAGMSEEVLAHLFEPFFTTKVSGTGLGLATAHGIVSQARGRIAVESTLGQGTVFQIYLPRCVTPPPAVERTPEPARRPTRPGASILVVEDEAALLRATRMILEAEGHTVFTALETREAERFLAGATNRIDLIICDITLPREAGPTFIERMRVQGMRIPVLFVSGYADHEPIEHGLVRGRDPFVQKPFTSESLLARVDELLAVTSGAGAST